MGQGRWLLGVPAAPVSSCSGGCPPGFQRALCSLVPTGPERPLVAESAAPVLAARLRAVLVSVRWGTLTLSLSACNLRSQVLRPPSQSWGRRYCCYSVFAPVGPRTRRPGQKESWLSRRPRLLGNRQSARGSPWPLRCPSTAHGTWQYLLIELGAEAVVWYCARVCLCVRVCQEAFSP